MNNRYNVDEFVNSCIDAEQEALSRWANAHRLLQRLLSTVKEVNGDYFIPHNGGYRMCPDGLNEALKDTKAYIDSLVQRA